MPGRVCRRTVPCKQRYTRPGTSACLACPCKAPLGAWLRSALIVIENLLAYGCDLPNCGAGQMAKRLQSSLQCCLLLAMRLAHCC